MTVTVRQPDSEQAANIALASPLTVAGESFEISNRAREVLDVLNDVFDGWETTKPLAAGI